MDVLVLLEARGRGERLPTVGAGVGPGPDVLRADVPLQIAGVCEHLLGGATTGTHGQRHPGVATPPPIPISGRLLRHPPPMLSLYL